MTIGASLFFATLGGGVGSVVLGLLGIAEVKLFADDMQIEVAAARDDDVLYGQEDR
jgi:hypothetical protein